MADDIVFSLDLKAGKGRAEGFIPSGNPQRSHISGGDKPLRSPTAIEIARRAIALGITRILVLDLSRVGVGSGPGTDDLIANFRREYPRLEVTAGGGVRGRADLDRLAQLGADAVLVASALHERRLTRADVTELAS